MKLLQRPPGMGMRSSIVLGFIALTACASSVQKSPPTTATHTSRSLPTRAHTEVDSAKETESRETEAAAAPEAGELEIPTSCASSKGSSCEPPPDFARELCKRSSADLALVMFQKSSPWKRAYLRADTSAWLAGSRLAKQALLRFDEEVIVIGKLASGPGQIQVGGGGYDVLRWDGTCFSVMADEVTFKRPPQPLNAPIEWKRLSDDMRDALLQNTATKIAHDRWRKRCKDDGAAPACEKASDELGRAVADQVRRGGGDLPGRRLVMR